MASYKFLTIWKFDAPIERVYQAIYDADTWTTWWDNIENVQELTPGGDSGIGRVERFTFRTALPYKLRFDLQVTRNERPWLLEGQATGELEGLGRWTLVREDNGTTVNYLWAVRTTRWWMNLLAPIARPLFARNHEAVMANGGKSLARYLNARLLHQEYLELDPSSPTPAPTPYIQGATQ